MLQKRLRVVYTFLAVGLALLMIGTPLLTQAARGEITQAAVAQEQPGLLLAPLLIDDFDYGNTAGNLTTITSSWVAHDTGLGTLVQYITTTLSMPGYGSSGVGGAATVLSTGTEDINRTFTSQSTGTVYFAALVNVSESKTGGDYFLHLRDTGTGFRNRIFARDDGGVLRFGLAAGSSGATTPVYSTDDFSYNTTYLIVGKYTVDNGNSALYVLEAATDTEPATPLLSMPGTASMTVQSVAIRQGGTSRPAATIDGVRVANSWEDVIGYTGGSGEITLTKTVTPTTNVTYHGTVTYTVVLDNSMAVSDTVLFTDTLPTEVTFGAWIEQPAGAVESGNEITWSGTLTASTALTFTFTATHVGDYGDIITNTAEFSGTLQAGTAEAAFTVEKNVVDVTFVYHDLEGVVQAGETVWLAGSFNSWTAAQMGDAGGGVYTYTVAALTIGDTYEYRYIVNDGITNQLYWLNTAERSYTIVDAPERHDYRNVVIGWANLQWPYTLDGNTFEATETVYGQLWINGLTGSNGPARGMAVQVGYGDMSDDPANWDWFPMIYNLAVGNNDEFMGVMTPTLGGVFSYTTRFDGNWGAGNPNADWYYAAETGVLTSTIYDIAVTKTALVSEIAVYSGEETPVAYIIEIENQSTLATVNTITLTDTLPAGFIYAEDNSGVVPTVDGDTLTWEFTNLAAGDSLSFTLVLSATDSVATGTAVNAVTIAVDPMDANVANNADTAEVMVYRILTIAEARTFTNTTQVTIEGIVTAEPGIFKDSGQSRKLYMEDATGGMLIYITSGNLNPVARHNRVRVTGAMAEYRSEREVIPASAADVVDLGPATPIVPQVLANNEVTEDVEGQLVQVAGYITEKPFAYVLRINDGTGEVDINRYFNLGQTSDPNYIDFTQFVVGDYVVVTGVSRGYLYGEDVRREILPRGPEDIIESPRVLAVTPAPDAVDVPANTDLTATFNMTITNVSELTFLLEGPLGAVAGNVTYDDATFTATFTPTAPLADGTRYTATLTQDLVAHNGAQLIEDYVWTFTIYQPLPDLSIAKAVTPDTNLDLGDIVTYTIVLSNDGDDVAIDILVTDTLPAGVTFGDFVIANGATETGGVITWSGDLPAGVQPLAIVFTATVDIDTDLYGETITNTVAFTSENAGDGMDAAAFTVKVETITTQVTFVYHDLEGVVPAGVTIHIAGNFNGWNSSATPMIGDSVTGIYTATITLETAPYTLEYKFIVGNSWDDGRGTLLNSDNRSALITESTTLHLYRNVRSGYAKLNGPAEITIPLGATTPIINGEAWFSNTFDENQVLRAQIGYGTDVNPANWTWVEATFSGRNGNNDIFTATLMPATAGVYSYTIRFDGNWGDSNPNTTWYLGDLAGVHPDNPFDIGNVGVLTVTEPAPLLNISKSVLPVNDVELGDTVTYTLQLSNAGNMTAYGILLTDTLPTGVTFGAFVDNDGMAVENAGVITWSGDLEAGEEIVIVFTATVDEDNDLYGETITNTVEFTSTNAGDGETSAAFTVKSKTEYVIFLPLVLRNFGTQ